MKLYDYYRSSTSFRIRIALNLKGIAFTRVPVDLSHGEQSDEAFARLNPHKSVPGLDTGGGFLVQSLAILDWLEAEYPEPSFTPQDIAAAQTCRELYYAIATEIHAVNNLPVLQYLREEFGSDTAVIRKWYAHWIARTFAPVEARLSNLTWLRDDLPFGAPGLFEIVAIPQIFNGLRWKADLSAFANLNRIYAHCMTLQPFIDAHPDNQPEHLEA